MRRRIARAMLFAFAFTLCATDARARDPGAYPDGPIRILVGFVPGGPTDLYARIAARVLADALGQQVVVENRPGGSGAIAAKAVAAAEPDGYTLLVNVVSDIIIPILNKKSGYSLQLNFVPIGLIASAPNVLVAGPATPVDSVQSLVAHARNNPGALSYASAGTATVSHLAGALLAAEAGILMTHVPYKGTSGAQVDLLAGRVSLMFDNLTNGLANARAGRVKALAVTSARRWPGAPELPTMAESGYAGVSIISSFGLVAPAGTPSPIVAALSAALHKGLLDEKVRKSIIDSGAEPGAMGPGEYASYIGDETRRWTRFLERNPGIASE
jgi:tripartite-type tricarboxylate transporter receptor subunit TctC